MARARLEEFALTPHPEKTRLIGFGHHAASRREKRGEGKPDLRLPGLYLDLRHVAARQIPAMAEVPTRSVAGKAFGVKQDMRAADASADPRASERLQGVSAGVSPTTRCRPTPALSKSYVTA